MVALTGNRNTAAAAGDNQGSGFNHCTDSTDFNDFCRFWRSNNTAIASAGIFFHDVAVFFFHHLRLFLVEELADRFGWIVESRIIFIDTNLCDHGCNRDICDTAVEQLFTQGVLKVVSDVSLAHGNTDR